MTDVREQRWARVFDVGTEHQVAVYICSDGESLGLMITAMVDDDMCGESVMYPGLGIDQVREKLDAYTQAAAVAWLFRDGVN